MSVARHSREVEDPDNHESDGLPVRVHLEPELHGR
jgi:hypothetical protein